MTAPHCHLCNYKIVDWRLSAETECCSKERDFIHSCVTLLGPLLGLGTIISSLHQAAVRQLSSHNQAWLLRLQPKIKASEYSHCWETYFESTLLPGLQQSSSCAWLWFMDVYISLCRACHHGNVECWCLENVLSCHPLLSLALKIQRFITIPLPPRKQAHHAAAILEYQHSF